MIYMDVTSAAASPVNMGVQRTVRGLYAHLKSRYPITPLRWDFCAKRYARLSSSEIGHLDHPFAAYKESSSSPGRWDWRHWLAAWHDWWSRGKRAVSREELFADGVTLMIPDLCWDPRIHSWKEMEAQPGKRIAIFHDAMPLRIPGQADSHDLLFAQYVRELNRLDLVICISKEVQEDLLRYWAQDGLSPKPTRVITWPVPFDEARPDNPANHQARHVIYVARLKLRKNHLILLKACETLWRRGVKFSLDLIGIADAFADTRTILRRVSELQRQGHPVRWRKHISDDELTAAYRDASFTAFPSRLEGFGLPIIESLWHERPVICGRNGAIGEVAEGGGCHQIDQNDAGELAAAIHELLTNQPLYDRLCREARTRIFRSWDDYGRELDEVLEAVTRNDLR